MGTTVQNPTRSSYLVLSLDVTASGSSNTPPHSMTSHRRAGEVAFHNSIGCNKRTIEYDRNLPNLHIFWKLKTWGRPGWGECMALIRFFYTEALANLKLLIKTHIFLTFLWGKYLESRESHKFPTTQHTGTAPDKKHTSLVWVGLVPETGKGAKRNVDTSHFSTENRRFFCNVGTCG